MTTQTSVNNRFTQDFLDVSRSETAGEVKTTIENTDNSSSSSRAYLKLETGGASGGDPVVVNFNNVAYYTYGIDNTDSDAFAISANASLGTSNAARCSTAGEWTYPSQSSFNANAGGTNANDVTGNNTEYAPAINTERFDIGSDYNTGTYKYVAPVDGIYVFGCNSLVTGMSGNSTQNYTRIKVGGTIVFQGFTGTNSMVLGAGGNTGGVIELDAADEVNVFVAVNGAGADTGDYSGSADASWFCGGLIA